ncbi:Fic family protein [Flavicella sp.]|uniref:Fic family protein n=1 Tax=Flavicella sp. TaxID=2957742 RepID=UPI00301B29FD
MLETVPKFTQEKETINTMVSLELTGALKKIQDEYLFWDKAKYKNKGLNPAVFWSAIKMQRKLKNTSISFGKYTFTFHITDFMHRALHQFDLNIGGTLSSNIGISETDKTKFIISSLIEEAISSSQMEGANTTRKKAKEMIQKELKPKSNSEKMILNNYVTMKHIVQQKNEDLTPESLLYVHKLITSNTLENTKEEGAFRKNDDIQVVNHIDGEVVHTPPKEENLNILLQELCVFFNEDQEKFIHPIVKACIIHFMIGWIHPFSDGNGRTARALFYWYMLKRGYWLTEYMSISRIIKDSKNQYEKAYLYTEIDDNDLNYFITYHIKTMEKAFFALKTYINKKQKEVVQSARFLKIPDVNDRMSQILKIVFDDADRVLASKEFEKRFDVSSFTARADLKKLTELGFLEILQINKIKKNYIKSSQFDNLLKNYDI